jgi:hypothetical protein
VVLPRDDRDRVYFSSRDAEGRSHVGFLETAAGDTRQIASVSRHGVLAPGELGAFDDAGVTTSCLVEHAGRVFLYYTGWSRGVSVPFYLAIGAAVSDDGGDTFARVSPAPIVERNAVDPFLTASPWILVENDVWRMWYVSGTGWVAGSGVPTHRYHIKYAESPDGVQWRRRGIVCIDYASPAEYAFGRPCVVRDGDRYRMWYSCRGDRYRLGYAESPDGITWTRRDAEAGVEPSSEGWDADMIAYPVVFQRHGQWRMLYNGNGYGRTGIGLAVAA